MDFSFERTFDFNVIKRIVTDRKVYPHVSDDSAPAPEDYRPDLDSAKFWHVLCRLDGVILGLFILLVGEDDAWEVHTCLLPRAYGKAAQAGRALLAWLWRHTPCRRIRTCVPEYNRLALRLAKDCGMTEYRRELELYSKFGKRHDVIFLETWRPEELAGEVRAKCQS